MKKITFVIADLGMGGAQRVLTLLARCLSEENEYQVDIIALSAAHQARFFDVPDTVKIHYADVMNASGGFYAAIKANLHRIRKLRALFKASGSDLIITFQTETNCIVLLSAWGSRVPVIVSERSDPYVYPLSRLWRFIRGAVYPLAAGAVFQTKHAADYFSGIIPQSAIIFNPVRIEAQPASPPFEQPYILGVGRLSVEKGFDSLIEAYARARHEIADLKLVLVGSGPEQDSLIKLSQSLGVAENVIFAGSQSQLSAYYKGALAFVLPSRFEGLPNALIEAMAYCCPVISSPMYKAAPEIIEHGHNGLIATSAAPEDMAAQIIHLFTDPVRRLALAEQGRIDSARFSEKTITAAWLRFLKKFV